MGAPRDGGAELRRRGEGGRVGESPHTPLLPRASEPIQMCPVTSALCGPTSVGRLFRECLPRTSGPLQGRVNETGFRQGLYKREWMELSRIQTHR